jgi:nucleotide-binding universal stress UspA family protein
MHGCRIIDGDERTFEMNIEKPALVSSIAVAIDGSRLSEEALPLAVELARQCQARISLITVLDTQVRERFAEFCRAEDISLVEAVRAYQDPFIKQLRDEGLLVARHVVELRENSSSGTIRDVAENLNASMLVIGSHGRSGVKRLVLGSTADALTRGGHIPVLVVRPTAAEAYAEL